MVSRGISNSKNVPVIDVNYYSNLERLLIFTQIKLLLEIKRKETSRKLFYIYNGSESKQNLFLILLHIISCVIISILYYTG